MYSRAPQFPQNAAPDSNCTPFGARLPSRFGAVALTSARARSVSSRLRFWIARSSICDPHAFASHSFS